jgi:predicted lipoprotein with Yx(FWY)xxD motif
MNDTTRRRPSCDATSRSGATLLLALAACSKGTTTAPPASGGSSTATVQMASTSLGSTLTNADGRTLYLFEQDTGTDSTCTGSCAATWPALTVSGQPTAGTGLDASRLGTTMRSDGKTQVTYNGHPVYIYSGDSAAGDTNGQGIGGVWFAMGANGAKLTAASSSGGGGYQGY